MDKKENVKIQLDKVKSEIGKLEKELTTKRTKVKWLRLEKIMRERKEFLKQLAQKSEKSEIDLKFAAMKQSEELVTRRLEREKDKFEEAIKGELMEMVLTEKNLKSYRWMMTKTDFSGDIVDYINDCVEYAFKAFKSKMGYNENP